MALTMSAGDRCQKSAGNPSESSAPARLQRQPAAGPSIVSGGIIFALSLFNPWARQTSPPGLSLGKNHSTTKLDEAVKSQNPDGFAKSPSLRRANLSGVRRNNVRRSDFEMRRNAEIGLFAKPSNFARRTRTP
jgi:hypothetical protein